MACLPFYGVLDSVVSKLNRKGFPMGYPAIALAVVGFGLGVTFRFKVLLPILVLLLIISIFYTATQGFNFPRAALAIIEVQSIVQVGYFFGIVLRAIVAGMGRMRPVL